jgi:hypothetical protein
MKKREYKLLVETQGDLIEKLKKDIQEISKDIQGRFDISAGSLDTEKPESLEGGEIRLDECLSGDTKEPENPIGIVPIIEHIILGYYVRNRRRMLANPVDTSDYQEAGYKCQVIEEIQKDIKEATKKDD